MFSLGFGNTRSGKIIAVADIESGSAGIVIIETSPSGPARIIASERATLPFEERSAEATRAGVITQLGEAAQKALAAFSATREHAHISSAVGIIRAPWTRSLSMRAESKFAKETRIESSLIDTLAREAIEGKTPGDRAKILEASVARVELNGYPTGTPVGKHAHHVVVSALLSECDADIASGVSETLSRVFACPPPTLRSGTRALLAVLRESSLLPKDCFVVNMTSNGTSLIVLRKGVVAETALLSEGSRSIVKRIAGEKMPEETLTLIRMLALDQCEAEACEAIKTALAKAEQELSHVFGEALGQLAAARRLPNALILSAHEDLAPWLVHFFSRIDFAQFTVTTRPFVSRALSRQDLGALVSFEGAVVPDIDLCVVCALVNIEDRSGT